MSGESSLAFLHSIYRRRSIFNKGLNKGTAAATFAVLSLMGVSGMAAVLTLIMRDLRESEVKETSSLEVIRVALPVAPQRRNAAHPQPALDHRHTKHMASLSSGKVHASIGKRGRVANGATRANGNASTLSKMNADSSKDYDEHVRGSTDSDMTIDATPQHNTTVTDKNEPAFAGVEDSREPSNGFNVSVGTDEGGEAKGSKEILNYSLSTEEVFGSSSPSRLQESPMQMSTLPSATRTTASSTGVPSASLATAASWKTTAATMTNSRKHLVVKHTTPSPTADNPSDIDNPEKRKAGSSTWLLFCFYDDRSSTRSPGFSVYDFPVQLCTDVAFCCVDVNAKGQVVMSKNLELFLEAMAHEFLPRNHLFVTLGGHRALAHHLDAALQNTARFATQLSEGVQRLGAGGLAVYLEDVEILKHAFRVHDLIMAVRGVSVAVVLPRDLRQQMRYYRTEIYANTKDMLVISSPSQGHDSGQLRPAFATCPHPRRSVREGLSLEFIYQLSRTLLSSMAYGSADYASRNVADAAEQPTSPRYLFGVSFGGLKFQLKNRSLHDVGSPATFIRTVTYHEICSQPWQHWHDNISECFVAWDGDRGWMSSLGPRSVGFATELADGLAVFDLDFDDHHGECGNKFPVLRALRAALIARHASKLT